MSSLLACSNNHEDFMIWDEPPTTPDSIYLNPLFEPDLSDPTVIKGHDGWFYAYGTENDWSNGLNRLVPIIKSKDLVNWEYSNDAFTSQTRPSWKIDGGGLWAPCVVFKDNSDPDADKYFMYYSISKWGDENPGIGLATSKYPTGPFTDQGKIFDSNSIGVTNSIDPFLFQTEQNGVKSRYLFWGSFFGIYGIEIGSDMKTTVGEKFQIAGSAFEAAYIYEKNGKYYFFGSVGSCCDGLNSRYHVTVAAADNFKGPYKTKDGADIKVNGVEGSPFLYGDADAGWVGPGHNSEIIVDDLGNEFMLYHAISVGKPYLPNNTTTRRPLLMDQVHWKDGWPYIEYGRPSNTFKAAPFFNLQ